MSKTMSLVTKSGAEALTSALRRGYRSTLYRAPLRDATGVGVMGSSLGGLMAFYQVHLYPESYDFAASLSGTFGWGSFGQHTQTMIDIYRSMSKVQTRLYLDSGGGTGDPCADLDGDGIKDDSPGGRDNYCAGIRQFLPMSLLLRGMSGTKTSGIGTSQTTPHAEWAWSERVWRPLENSFE